MESIDSLAELLSRCARDDEQAFARLYRQVAPTLFSLILRMVKRRDWAEEILQEAFVNIWHGSVSILLDQVVFAQANS
jgi:RNA polymerase sigma-70 factor, ECF subfamily